MRLSTIAIALAVTAAASAQQIAQVVDSTNFCVFLPPAGATDVNISDTEGSATAYCMGSTPQATGAGKLPSGFILSAHYVSTSAYVQITGQIDPSKAGLNPADDGGQYDVRAPVGSQCAGWTYYVNLIEPSGNDFCIRCCNDTTNCNRGISQAGCARIVPGDYSGPGVPSGTTSSSSPASVSNSTTSSSTSSTATKPSSHTAAHSSAQKPAASSTALPTEAVSAQSASGAADLIKPAFVSLAALVAASAYNLF